METFEDRSKRIESNPPEEYICQLFLSCQNFFLPEELEPACERKLSNLLILGIHSVVEVLCDKVFQHGGKEGFRFYLENFVDHPSIADRQFSTVSDQLNLWRNVVAHHYISQLGHFFGFDYGMNEGFKWVDGLLHFNPRIYFEQFKGGFDGSRRTQHGLLSDFKKFLTIEQMEKGKQRFLKAFRGVGR